MRDRFESLTDRGVLVTGAASGIGRATALLCADAGARVCAVDRDEVGLAATVAELAGDPDRHLARPLDLADSAALEPLVEEADATVGLWALVNVAALLVREPFDVVTSDSWDRHVDVNLKATFFLNRAAGRVMAASGDGGRIVNFTSTSWLTGPVVGSDVYVATKAGVISLTRGFARRFGPDQITVNAIAPGQIDTPMQHRDNDPESVRQITSTVPLGRMGDPREVAAVALFLISDAASYVSGATVNVSGAGSMY